MIESIRLASGVYLLKVNRKGYRGISVTRILKARIELENADIEK